MTPKHALDHLFGVGVVGFRKTQLAYYYIYCVQSGYIYVNDVEVLHENCHRHGMLYEHLDEFLTCIYHIHLLIFF